MYYIRQLEKDDCGFACVKIMLANLNKDENYLFLEQDLNHENYTFQELIDLANYHGLSLKGYVIEDKEDFFSNMKEPYLAAMLLEEKRHLVYVYRIDKKRIYVLDPLLGRISYSHEEFISLSDAHVLMIEDHIKKKCEQKPEKFKYNNLMYFTAIFRVLSLISLFLGIYFLNKNFSYIYPLIFTALGFIFEILYRSQSIRMFKKIDQDLGYALKGGNVARWNKYYEAFEKQKGYAISYPGTILLSAVLCAVIILISILNSVYNVIPILMCLIIALIDLAVIKPKLKSMESEIAREESSLFKLGSYDKRQMYVEEIHSKSYKYGLYKMSFSLISLFAIFASIFVVMLLNQIMDLTYVIFYGFLFYELLHYLKELLSYQDKVEEFNYYRCLIQNSGAYKKD